MKPALIFYSDREKEFVVDAPFAYKETLDGLTSRRWDVDTKTWRIPSNLPALEELLSRLNGNAQVHDGVWGMLQSKRDHSESFSSIKERLDLKPDDATYAFYTIPHAHQIAGTEAILKRDRVLLLDQPGLGKTKQMLDAAVQRMKDGLIKRLVIVVPASLKYNWVKEINKHVEPKLCKILVIEGNPKERKEQYAEALKYNFIIINYELARRDVPYLDKITDKEMLCCDEAHKLKNMKAKITKAIHSMNPKYAVLATGTPIANKPEDVFSLTHFVERGLLGMSEWQFEKNFCKKGGFEGKVIMGYKNVNEFRSRLDTVSIRRLSKNVLDLPEKVYEIRQAPMTGDQAREYKRMRDDMVTFYKELPEKDFRLKALDSRSQLLRLQQIADGFVSAGGRDPQWFSENAKGSLLDEIVTDVCGNGEKLVVWSRFLPVTEKIHNQYPQHNPVRIYGDVPKKERFELVDRFQNDPDTRLMVSQVHTGAHGFDMYAAQTQVFYDLWWSPAINEQAEERLHRMGQTGTVVVIRLSCEDSIDQYLLKMLDDKQQWSDLITGDDLRITKSSLLTLLGEEPADAKDQTGSRERTSRPRAASAAPDNPGRSRRKVAPVRSGARQVRNRKTTVR